MLLNLNTGYADTDADLCFKIKSLCWRLWYNLGKCCISDNLLILTYNSLIQTKKKLTKQNIYMHKSVHKNVKILKTYETPIPTGEELDGWQFNNHTSTGTLLHAVGNVIPLGKNLPMTDVLFSPFLLSCSTDTCSLSKTQSIYCHKYHKQNYDWYIYIYSSTSTKIKLFTTWKLEIKIIVRATLHPCLKSFLYKIYIQTLNHLQSTSDSSNVDTIIIDSWHTFNYTCYL